MCVVIVVVVAVDFNFRVFLCCVVDLGSTRLPKRKRDKIKEVCDSSLIYYTQGLSSYFHNFLQNPSHMFLIHHGDSPYSKQAIDFGIGMFQV